MGGRVECDLSVRPNQQLYLMVGSVPTNEYTASYNASDIRVGGTEYAHRVIVAGGGGSSSSRKAAGGAGGGLTGGNGGKGYGASSMGKVERLHRVVMAALEPLCLSDIITMVQPEN